MVNAIVVILIAVCVVLKVLIYVRTRRSDTTDHRHHDDYNRNEIEMNDVEVGGQDWITRQRHRPSDYCQVG